MLNTATMGSVALDENNATLPAIIDQRARFEPNRLYGATTWIEESGTLKCRKLTYRDVAETVDRCAHWLHTKFGRSSDYATLGYVGPNDYRYNFVTVAAAKLGYRVRAVPDWSYSRICQTAYRLTASAGAPSGTVEPDRGSGQATRGDQVRDRFGRRG